MPSSPPSDVVPDERLRLIMASYCRLTGKDLIDKTTLHKSVRGECFPFIPFDTPRDARHSGRTGNVSNHASESAGDAALREALWDAPRAIVAHGTEADPVFFYGNRLALQLFEMSFEEFARLPSRFSAEPLAREERAALLAMVTQQGYVDGYSGMRIAKSGRRFMISDGTVWNLVDEAGVLHGQAAVFVPQL